MSHFETILIFPISICISSLNGYTVNMKRQVIRPTEGTSRYEEVGDDWSDWNETIGARWGTLVTCPDGRELWCDDEGLLVENPAYNVEASLMAGQDIVGATIVFMEGDVE